MIINNMFSTPLYAIAKNSRLENQITEQVITDINITEDSEQEEVDLDEEVTPSEEDVIEDDISSEEDLEEEAFIEEDLNEKGSIDEEYQDDDDSVEEELDKPISLAELPEVDGDYILTDDFEDGELSDNIELILDGGTVTEEEGELVLERTSTDRNYTAFQYYINPDQTDVEGIIGIEFTAEREILNNQVNLRIRDANGGDAVIFDLTSSKLIAMYRTSLEGNEAWHPLDIEVDGNGPFKFNILFNTELNMFSAWVNGEKVIENAYSRVNVAGLGYLYVYLQNNNPNTVKIDDYKVYNVAITEKNRLDYDYEWLTFYQLSLENKDMITSDLNLPTTGEYGSTITWNSSDPDVISEDGKVTQQESGEIPVTLTALITNRSQEKAKTFDLIVVESIEMPEVVEVLGEEDFEDGVISDRWVLDDSGGEIQIDSGELQITRDTNEEITIADYYFNDDQSYIGGITGVEFTMKRTDPADAHIRLRHGSDYFAARWDPSGDLHVMYRETSSASATWYNVGHMDSEGAKLTLLFNPENTTYSLWINNNMVLENVYARTSSVQGIEYLRVYIQRNDFTTVTLDDIKYYQSLPLSKDRVNYDYEWLNLQEILTTEQDNFGSNVISSDLELPNEGKYGSAISWKSSDETIINTDGEVTRPGDEYDDDPEVILTAEITANGVTKEKAFNLRVLRELTTPESIVNGDYQFIEPETISLEGNADIRMSLNFVTEGIYGSEITWTSSDTSVITESGRVIRPLAGEPDQTVEVAAELTYEGETRVKTLAFTVLADEIFVDPQHMTDEDFFGKWDSETATWTTEGKFDYANNSDLERIEEAVKNGAGNYTEAKEELLTYIRNRENPYQIDPEIRDTDWVNMTKDDVYHLQGSEYYQGEMMVGNEWDYAYADVKPEYIAKGGVSTYSITAWHNESSALEIASKDHPDSELHPQIEVVVNGEVRTYTAEEDATIRAGGYSNTNYGNDQYLMTKMFGEFLDQDTYKSLIKFEFPDIKEDDEVESARLILYSRAVPDSSGSKRILILKEPTNTWSEDTVVWDTLPGYVYSFNGLPDKTDWLRPQGADQEYMYQMTRFSSWINMAIEYDITNDEIYAYDAIRIMEDFIKDMGGWAPGGKPSARGGYPRSLDAAIRLTSWMYTIDYFADSESMTAESNAAILKHIWDMANSLVHEHAAGGNWRQQEHTNLLRASLYFPEFTDANEVWFEQATDVLEGLIYENFFEDGSYMESTAGYNTGAFGLLTAYKRIMEEEGQPVSDEYDELLHRAAYYTALLYNPDGSNLQYGDEMISPKPSHRYPYIYEWYGDEEFQYIDTHGEEGVEPSWTSRMWPDSRLTIMRSDWTTDSLQLFTNVRGGGDGHGHADDGHVTVYAHGRTLLNDAGIFTYTSTDQYRRWGTSTRAHNTVEINDTSQRTGWGKGTIHDWSTGSGFDFLSQSTRGTLGYDHQRTITFIKPDFWIVSDLMTPDDMEKENSYKQLWHMLPGAGLTVDEDNQVIRSNYAEGANIIVASADGDDVLIHTEDGWYDRGYQQLESAKYGYYSQDDVVGQTTFDTVLMPTNNDPDAQVVAEALELDVDKSTATALKLSSDVDDEENTGYYYLSYEDDPQTERTFENYTVDGQMAYVNEQADGAIDHIIIKNASFVKDAESDQVLVSYPEKITDLTIEQDGNRLNVLTTDPDLEYNEIRILASEAIESLSINDVPYDFEQEDGYLVATDERDPEDEDPGNGEDPEEDDEQLQELLDLINDLETRIQELEANNDVEDLENKLQNLEGELEAIQAQFNELETQDSSLQQQIDQLHEEIAKLRDLIADPNDEQEPDDNDELDENDPELGDENSEDEASEREEAADKDSDGEKSAKEEHDRTTSEESEQGDKLPSTATSTFNYLFLGLVLFAVGLAIFFLYRKKIVKDDQNR